MDYNEVEICVLKIRDVGLKPTLTRVLVLSVLRCDLLSVGEIAKRLDTDRSNIHRVCKEMHKKGLTLRSLCDDAVFRYTYVA